MLRLASAALIASGGVALILGTAGPAARQVTTSVPPPALSTEPPTRLDQVPAAVGVPRSVRISTLGVNAPVVPVRMEASTLAPPRDARVVGWWSAGARPGAATGTALLTAHTVHSGGGAFDDLGELVPGDTLRVVSTSGSHPYVVRTVEAVDKDDLARRAAELFDQAVPGRLALVTCTDWDGRHYLSNTVVIATPREQ